MAQVIAVLLPIVLLAFWAWMFSDMTRNDNLPACLISVTGGRDPRLDWNVAVILLNIVAAVIYYLNDYRCKD